MSTSPSIVLMPVAWCLITINKGQSTRVTELREIIETVEDHQVVFPRSLYSVIPSKSPHADVLKPGLCFTGSKS
jgi:hypothetical protein